MQFYGCVYACASGCTFQYSTHRWMVAIIIREPLSTRNLAIRKQHCTPLPPLPIISQYIELIWVDLNIFELDCALWDSWSPTVAAKESSSVKPLRWRLSHCGIPRVKHVGTQGFHPCVSLPQLPCRRANAAAKVLSELLQLPWCVLLNWDANCCGLRLSLFLQDKQQKCSSTKKVR